MTVDDSVSKHSTGEVVEGHPAGEAADPQAREAASELLRALAAPTRIAIVLNLREHSRCVHELVGLLGLSQPLVSQHLRVLKDAGVVRGHRHGREIMYELVDHHLAHIVTDAITHVQEPRDDGSAQAPTTSGRTVVE
ncbi:ArsR/SmtB family transcription factor [Gordonia soli]|uniref:Putative ArsR family transcriptional regulator n=1 Tax=Gordonia soli NBRC 108243 TaxID=1223545 RepID=M0QM98_9ACTN|nr:metalloregulator ArsR/SmtB family transcription factor [Gordonia soli]GAC69396.1 putative ArsR family transcriptional regulator [Gordonia soli NBRC 108243]